MARLVADRLLQAVVALIALSAIVFATSRASGDPLQLLLPIQATQEDFDRARRSLGLDQPLIVQYGTFVGNVVRGDLGQSLRSREEVSIILAQRLISSLELGAAALVLTYVVALPLGVISAVRRGTAVDTAVKVIALLGQSMPSFWIGLILIQIFAVNLRWLPAGTDRGLGAIVLPSVTIALFGIAGVARLLRSSMLEVLDSDFVRVARAKGLRERTIVWRHAFRNSLIPVTAFGGLYLVNLLSFAIVVETVFAWPGIGSLAYTAVVNRDFPLIQGVALMIGVLAIAVNLAVDILYSAIDPRIRHAAH